nr:cytidine deaminase [Clostridium sp.]
QNAIISARRHDMLGATLYLVGKEVSSGELVEKASPCSLCKRFIINSGIEKVIIRESKLQYKIVFVEEWIENDDSLQGDGGY